MAVVNFICGLLLLGVQSALAANDGRFTLNFVDVPLDVEKGIKLQQAANPLVTKDVINLSLARVTLPPCAARAMHIHMNTDELHFVVSGTFIAMAALPNGTVISDKLTAGQSFVAPANYIHSMLNPSCTKEAIFMGFYGDFNNNNNNVGAGALNMVGSPFEAYVADEYKQSLQHAVGVFSFDPHCLTTCKLGSLGGQLPA